MELQGERLIPASVDATWAALNDPAVLKACIAGCESLERSGEDAYTAVVAVKIGPVSARFKGNLKMSNVQAPNSYTINFDGQGGVAGFGKGSADVALKPEGAQTRLAYVARAQVGGKLAQIGSRLIDAAAAKIAEDFFKAFEAHLQATHDAASELEPMPATAPAATAPEAATAKAASNSKLWWAVAAVVVVALVYFLGR
jgi:carbon monoxide dehydrogenase subunit G